MKTGLLVLITSLATAFSVPLPFHKCKFLDLTHTIETGIPHWGDIDFQLKVLVRGEFGKLDYVEANAINVPEHFGTHVDAPAHFFNRTTKRIDKIPIEDGIGPACVFDISERIKETGDDDYGLTVEDVENWEAQNGRVPKGCIALVYSGWEFKWTDPTAYLGTNTTDLNKMKFPAFGRYAGELLAGVRRVKAVGTDTLSIDVGSAGRESGPLLFPVHYSVLGRNLLAYENLNNLHKLPPFGAVVAMLPMKTKEGSGGPIRAFAVGWDGPDDPCRVENKS